MLPHRLVHLKARCVGRQLDKPVQSIAHDAEHGRDADAHADQQHLAEIGMLLRGCPKGPINDDPGCLQICEEPLYVFTL